MSKVIQLKDIVNLRRETLLPKDSNKKLHFVGLKHIDSGVSTLKRWGDASEVKSVKSRFYPNDVLYGKLRPYLDKAIIAEIEGICSSDILVLTANSKVMPRFLVYLLHSHTFRSYAVSTSSGITLPRTSWSTLGKFTFTLPPLPEQERIVAKLEALFTQLGTAVDSLKKAQAQLQRYRRSILKAAFERELTRTCSEEDRGIVQFKDIVNLRRETVQLDDSNKELNFVGLKYIDSGVSTLKRWGKASEVKSTKARFYPNDVLYGRLNPHLDKAVIAEIEGICSTDILVFTANSKIMPRFLVYLLHSYPFRSHAMATTSGITLPRTSWSALGEFAFTLPPLTEQEQIISEIECCLSIADGVEATIASELTRSERLRQSILQQAFSGQLVPQDPNDEPASVLLEEIQDKKADRQLKQKRTTTKSKAAFTNQLSLPIN